MAPSTLDLNALSASICRGIVEGNGPLVSAIIAASDKGQEIKAAVAQNSAKNWELDGEVKLIKGVIVALQGNGDGSTGMVPGMQRDMKAIGDQVARLTSAVDGMALQVSKLMKGHAEQKSWTDGWKGVGIAIGIMSACLTMVGTLIAAIVWLFTHGVRP